jgi:hypothetical protein
MVAIGFNNLSVFLKSILDGLLKVGKKMVMLSKIFTARRRVSGGGVNPAKEKN